MEGYQESIEQKKQIINNKNSIQDCDVIENLNGVNKNIIQVQSFKSFMSYSSNEHQPYQIYKDKNESSHSKVLKTQQNIPHLNSSDKLNSIIDLDSTNNYHRRKQGILFLDVQSRVTYFKDNDKLVEDKNENQSINSEKMQLKYNNKICNKSFLSENIEIEETEEILCNNPSEEVKSIVMKQQLRDSRDKNTYNQNMNGGKLQQYGFQQPTLINQQIVSSQIINPLNYDFGINLEEVIAQYSEEQLKIKEQQLKCKFQDYFANQKCKCNQVLIVDDFMFNLLVLDKILKIYGITSDYTTRAKIAIKAVKQKAKQNVCCKHYKLIFMGIDNPILDGHKTTKTILDFYKQKFQNVKPPIISAYTAFNANPDRMEAKKTGMKFYLIMPINLYCLGLIIEYCFLKQ